jgi:hypothetical protein
MARWLARHGATLREDSGSMWSGAGDLDVHTEHFATDSYLNAEEVLVGDSI